MAESGLADLRFEGYDYDALADQVDRLRQGPGSESLFKAVRALMQIADGLADTDRALREELAKIGVEWQGAAADGGVEATKQSSVYAADAVPTVAHSAGGVSEQGDTFSTTRNSAPDGSQLRGATQMNMWDKGMGLVGHTTPHAAEVQRTQAARQQAIGSMNDYARGSQNALGNFQNLPVPPAVGVGTQQPGSKGTTGVQSFHGGQDPFTPTGGGSTNRPQLGTPLPGNFTGASPIHSGPAPTVGLNPVPGTSQLPALGRVSGIGPVMPPMGGLPVATNALNVFRTGFSGQLMGEIATAAGIAGAGGAGAAAGSALEKDKVVRGGSTQGPQSGQGKQRPVSPIAGAPEEEARAARSAEKIGGSKSGKPASSLMQPAAGAAANGEDDEEHVRKYGIDSEDLFGDDRLVIAPVLGEDD
ncbi:PPE domain-containing protein [Actinokineospora terrae]|uniref:PPE family protein n=1 Tax=Actinokineospora terrae TaxID=155974 RepID=A0A1H9W0X7_9PSEU|nr:PPE domain-containing protein [Actinokineospora terrae]SES27565.1 PPE family protein [Actinokineospora terrae]